MLSNEAEFAVLLARYDDDPAICSKILRTHALTDPKIFLAYAQKALLTAPVSRALKFIAGLAVSAGIMDVLVDLYPYSRNEALTIANKLMACDPRFDATFFEHLQKPRQVTGEENFFHIGLDILDFISQSDRLVPGVLKLLKHPNPKVRSKAALFIGGRTQNLAWANRIQEYDARVRANIVESLYGVNSDFVRSIYAANVNDENNRVAGNAVLGLYLLGESSAIPIIHDMSRHPDARFRNTCAWVMGRTGDPRFAQAFSELMNDPDELVRAQAFKGLSEVRKALRASATRPQLQCAIVRVQTAEPYTATVVLHNALRQPVRGIRPTSFILKSGSPLKVVRNYTVEEHDRRSSLTVAFLLSLPADNEQLADAHFVQAIQMCNDLRRPRDRWLITKLSATIAPPRAGGPPVDPLARYRQKWALLNIDVESANTSSLSQNHPNVDYSVHEQRIEAMQREKPLVLGSGPADEASKLAVASLLRTDIATGNPHLIFFGAGPRQQLLELLTEKGADLPATVHILAHSTAWQTAEARELAARSGGSYRVVPDASHLPNACFELYSSLLHSYRITWSGGSADNLELDMYSETGKASAGYEPEGVQPQTAPLIA